VSLAETISEKENRIFVGQGSLFNSPPEGSTTTKMLFWWLVVGILVAAASLLGLLLIPLPARLHRAVIEVIERLKKPLWIVLAGMVWVFFGKNPISDPTKPNQNQKQSKSFLQSFQDCFFFDDFMPYSIFIHLAALVQIPQLTCASTMRSRFQITPSIRYEREKKQKLISLKHLILCIFVRARQMLMYQNKWRSERNFYLVPLLFKLPNIRQL